MRKAVCASLFAVNNLTSSALVQGLTMAPRVATMWYLYCETCTHVLEHDDIVASFEEAFKFVNRCAPRRPRTMHRVRPGHPMQVEELSRCQSWRRHAHAGE